MHLRRLLESALHAVFTAYRRMRPRLDAAKTWARHRARSSDLLRRAYYDPYERDRYRARNATEFSDAFAHEQMLADAVRVDAYDRALSREVPPGAVVADIGTGTGILAMLAARHGAGCVHAIDHSSVIDWARRVADAHGEHRIQFHRVHSGDFAPEEPIDLIVHEQLGDWLFDERMLHTLLDLRDRVLAPGGMILPHLFELHVAPVELVASRSVPFLHQIHAAGIDFGVLRDVSTVATRTLRHTVAPADVEAPLARTGPMLTVDVHRLAEPRLPSRLTASHTVTRAGRLDGFCVSFVAHLSDGIRLDTSPFADPSRRPSDWTNGLLRVETRRVVPGDRIDLELTALDLARPETWAWRTEVVHGTAPAAAADIATG